MILTDKQLAQLETPCLVIDVEQARKNIEHMQQAAHATKCLLRPHIKTHKMPFFAKMQLEAGCSGITCAKVSEAEIMADAGISDIFIAYPVIGDFRIKRVLALAHRIKRLIIGVDSIVGAKALNKAALDNGIQFEIRLEIDTGAGRTGISLEKVEDIALEIYTTMKGLNLTGIYTFKSLVYQGKPTTDNYLAAQEEGQMMEHAASLIRAKGIPLIDISAGSSPTGEFVAQTGKVNEIRPGTYIFKDVMLEKEGVAQASELAVKYVATVVSCPRDDYAVIDGGTKTFPTDVPLHVAPVFYPGYAFVEGSDHLVLSRMNEEHGMITSTKGKTGLVVGQIITLLPIHVCTAINMQNTVYLLEDGNLRIQKVDARGMLV